MSLASSVDVLGSALLSTAGVWVRYRRGAESRTLKAIPGETTIEEYGVDDATTTVRSDDWIIRPKDLGFEPNRGDVITNTETKETFEVLPIQGERPFRQTDQTGRLWRIHTKRN